MLLRDLLKKELQKMGVEEYGIASANSLKNKHLSIENIEYAGEMKWLLSSLDKSMVPDQIFPNAQSIVVTLWPYGTEKCSPYIARYACHADYHEYIRNKLQVVATKVFKDAHQYKICVDSSPIAEKVFAAHAGLGFIGKNSLLINPRLGSFFCIGLIVTDSELQPDQPLDEDCGDCTNCIEACPTKAIVKEGIIDCRKCIAYLTIEHKGGFPENLKSKTGHAIFGCDICQEVCPYNDGKKIKSVLPKRNIKIQSLITLLELTDEKLKKVFKNTPIERAIGRGLKRNITNAINNSRDQR